MDEDRAIMDYATMAERDLVSYAKMGSEMAFSELYKRTYQPVVNYVTYWLKQWDSEDIVQEAFLRAYQYISGFRGNSSFATWVTRIASQLVVRNHRNAPEFVPLNDNVSVQNTEDVVQSTQREKVLSLLAAFLKTLPHAQRGAFMLHTQEGLSYAAISQKTGKNTQTLRKACQRARRKWRSYYKAAIWKEAELHKDNR